MINCDAINLSHDPYSSIASVALGALSSRATCEDSVQAGLSHVVYFRALEDQTWGPATVANGLRRYSPGVFPRCLLNAFMKAAAES